VDDAQEVTGRRSCYYWCLYRPWPATALAFARRGANLSLAARQEDALHQSAQECRHFGGRTLVVPTDVTDEAAVQNLAQRTVQEGGRLEIWVNNAATAFGRFEETPPGTYRRVIETNLFGYIHGARAALPYFREQGSGTLINIASIDSLMGMPYVSAYVASSVSQSVCTGNKKRHIRKKLGVNCTYVSELPF
jgi:NAD(P)-dependent dehydrogenase (short-subunit alcohol dehydrogenase family)